MVNEVKAAGEILATLPVHGSRALSTNAGFSGKSPPQSGKPLPQPAAQIISTPKVATEPAPPKPAVATQPQPKAEHSAEAAQAAQVATRINDFLRESGRAISFRVTQNAGRTVVEEVDPDTGRVISELTSDDLLSLAKGLGISGLVIDSRA
jgi:flagellar protein FlaG